MDLSSALGQIRTKQPDRGVYQPPRIASNASRSSQNKTDASQDQNPESGIADLIRGESMRGDSIRGESNQIADRSVTEDPPERDSHSQTRYPLMDVALESIGTEENSSPRDSQLQRVGHEEVILVQPNTAVNDATLPAPAIERIWIDANSNWSGDPIIHDGTCDGCVDCDLAACDAIGCDSIGHCNTAWYHKWTNGSLSCDPERWFGSAELLLMFRKGVLVPPLVTTGPDDDPDTAGELLQPDTVVVVGNGSILKDMQAGGRVTLGTWLDRQQCRSLVTRAWFAGRETFRFGANQDQIPVIARPFLNVSDSQAAAQDAQLVAFPERTSGSISVGGENEVFGGDISVRQFWYGKYGATVDVLYGYQYMRMNESLGIFSTSTSLDPDFAPVGAVISVADAFRTQNDFHGGQFGFATRYREGCWSFNGLLKVGFGSLRRRAKLSGATLTSIDNTVALDPNGLLVRSTNAGTSTDHTFGWVPELDLSVGWQRFPQFDVTFGYHVIAMTDALQVSGAIDPTLSVNLSDPPTGQQRPAAIFQYKTFYVQGIHFGLEYIY